MRLSTPSSAIVPPLFLVLALMTVACADRDNDADADADADGDAAADVGDPYVVDPETHRAEVEAWRADRDERLRRPDGWLTLVGLEWLPESGAATAGSGAGSDVAFPETAPAEVGTFRRDAAGITFAPASGVTATVDGEAIAGPTPLSTDAEGAPSEVVVDTFRFHLIEREGRVAVRIKDAASPLLAAFAGMESWPVDPAWRLVARFVPYEEGRTMMVPNILGDPTEEPAPGALEFTVDGETYRLDAMDGGPDELFIVFGDATNGDETYGGGRFVYTPRADAQGRVVLDFNRAYNPPCVFTPYATCPLPPPQNRLPFAVRAGEKDFTDGHH